MEQKRLTLSEYDAIVAFDRLCFPQDHWTEEDWRELLADARAQAGGGTSARGDGAAAGGRAAADLRRDTSLE